MPIFDEDEIPLIIQMSVYRPDDGEYDRIVVFRMPRKNETAMNWLVLKIDNIAEGLIAAGKNAKIYVIEEPND